MFKAIWISDHLARLGITANLLIGAYLTPSRLLASLGYNNRCYTQNFVRVNGCCWWILFVCWSVTGLQCMIHLGSKNYPTIHSFSHCSLWSIPWVLSFWYALQLFKTSILQTLLAISNPTYLVTNCKYGHFIFLIPFRSYTMAEWQNISVSHAGYTYAIFIFHFPKLLHVSFKPLHLELSFRCTILSSAMAHHPFFIKFFRHYSCGTSSRAIQLGKIFSLLFGEYEFCMVGHFFFRWWFPKMLQQTINSWHLQQA